MNIFEIATKFAVNGTPASFEECKVGHINNTYIVDFDADGYKNKFILQRINTYVFKNPNYVMSNIIGVTTFLKNQLLQSGGNPERGTLSFINCRDNPKEYCYRDHEGGCWRMYHYIDNVISYALAESTDLFEKAGFAFGNFQHLLSDYDASSLFETIPNFHNTKLRYSRFLEVLKNASAERKSNAAEEIKFILSREEQCSFIVNEISNGNIPLRVTHNDTKLNNILMDPITNEGVCIIDLDTVMPGSALYDFGDAIRFGASNALEDEKDLNKVFFRTDMFEAFAKGYLRGTCGSLTEHEIECLPLGAYIITFETGLRFLTDYLENDVYFKTSYSDHNLVRAKNQLKLVLDIETRMNEFDNIIKKFV